MMEADFLRLCHLDIAEAYQNLFLHNDLGGILTKDEQELILVGAYAAFGSEADVAEHGRKALEAGACPEAVVEAVLAATISRGEMALRTALPFLSGLPLSPGQPRVSGTDAGESPLEYLASQLGGVPDWARRLQEFSPHSVASYALLRSRILADAAASRKMKELLTMLLNAVTGNTPGIRSHALGAVQRGADVAQVLGVLLLGVRIGGIVVWINGVNALSEQEWQEVTPCDVPT